MALKHEPMIVRFRFPDSPSHQPIQLFFHVAARLSKESVDVAQMKVFTERTNAFLDALAQESDRGTLLIAAEYMDQLLRQLIEARMLPGADHAVKGFTGRIKLASAVGRIGAQVRDDLTLLCKMRDHSAHSHEAVYFTHRALRQQCAAFKALRFFSGRHLQPRGQFFFGVAMLALHLDYLCAISQRPRPGIDPEIVETMIDHHQ